jgi:hypothetical protein
MQRVYEVDFFEAGLTPANVLIVHGKRGFINRNLFQLWAERVLFPAIERRRVEYDYERDAVVIPDGCTNHDFDWFLEKALARGMILYWLPLHSSSRTQPLDLGLFGLTKRALNNMRPDSNKTAQSNQLIRVLHTLHLAGTPKNIAGSFRRAGLAVQWDMEHEHVMARIKRYTQRQVPFVLHATQKKHRRLSAIEKLKLLREREPFDSNSITTGDESWFQYHYESREIFAPS